MKINIILFASSALTSERAERQAAPKPARANRGTRMALRPSKPAKPAQAGLEPRPAFPLGNLPPSSAGEGLS